MEVCDFCGKKFRNLLKLAECRLMDIRKGTVPIQELIKIFNREIVKLIVKSNERHICKECLKQLSNCYEFASKLQEMMAQVAAIDQTVNDNSNDGQGSTNCGSTALTIHQSKSDSAVFRQVLPKENYTTPVPIKELIKLPSPVSKSSRRYICFMCGIKFASYRKMKQHELQHTSCNNDRCEMHICEYCHMVYSQQAALNSHLAQQHSAARYQCMQCKEEKNYKSRGFLLQHYLKVHHQASIGYYCGDCNESSGWQNISAVQQHFLEQHLLPAVDANNKISAAGNCQTVADEQQHQFNDSDIDLEMHEEFLDEFLLTHEDSFQFDECFHELNHNLPDMFTISNQQADSQNANCTTTQLNPQYDFVCPRCSPLQQFKYPHKLIQHLIQQHNYPTTNSNDSKSMLCPYCSKSYNNISKLKQHLRIVHSQCKRHVCQLCDRQFTTIDHLRKHVLSVHQNERKHICDVCNKRFTQISHLRQHHSIHTNGKSHHCQLCAGKFWRKIDLARHLHKVHQMSMST